MEWHFSPETGSAYWLQRAETLPFNPRTDVKSIDDLALFPNIVDELRDVRVEDLIPRGYGQNPGIVGIYESGGTTGAPKRVVVLRDWWDRHVAWTNACLDALEVPGNVNWLALVPSGPHQIGEVATSAAASRGGIKFSVDAGAVVGGRTRGPAALGAHGPRRARRTRDLTWSRASPGHGERTFSAHSQRVYGTANPAAPRHGDAHSEGPPAVAA